MLLNVCTSKIHGLRVTDGDLNYAGSVTVDGELVDAAGLIEGQMVQITNKSNAVLWRTYVVKGEPGKGQVILNGPPARLFQKGDIIYILGEAWMEAEDAAKRNGPTVVRVDENNRIVNVTTGH
jgi:aspartate 1-decarboxylase